MLDKHNCLMTTCSKVTQHYYFRRFSLLHPHSNLYLQKHIFIYVSGFLLEEILEVFDILHYIHSSGGWMDGCNAVLNTDIKLGHSKMSKQAVLYSLYKWSVNYISHDN